MLQFVVTIGTVYLFYRLAVRQLIRSRIAKNRLYDRLAYIFFLLAGSGLALYVSILYLFPYIENRSIWMQSLPPTVVGIWLGEIFYSRNLVMTLRMLKRIRSKEGQINE